MRVVVNNVPWDKSCAALALILCLELSLCFRDVMNSLPWQRVARLTGRVQSSVIAPFVTPMIVGVCLAYGNSQFRNWSTAACGRTSDRFEIRV